MLTSEMGIVAPNGGAQIATTVYCPILPLPLQCEHALNEVENILLDTSQCLLTLQAVSLSVNRSLKICFGPKFRKPEKIRDQGQGQGQDQGQSGFKEMYPIV